MVYQVNNLNIYISKLMSFKLEKSLFFSGENNVFLIKYNRIGILIFPTFNKN